jgi:hypothetical protein
MSDPIAIIDILKKIDEFDNFLFDSGWARHDSIQIRYIRQGEREEFSSRATLFVDAPNEVYKDGILD